MNALAVASEDLRGRGRPSNAELSRSLERARLVNVSLRERLRAEELEHAAFAEAVRVDLVSLRRGILLGREDLVDQAASAIGYRAARHARQRSGFAL